MADPLFEFDPTSEDATNSPLSVWNTSSYAVTAFKVSAPPFEVTWAGSVDTEGALPASVKPGNRTISLTVECLTAAALRALQAKAAKITRERGTAKITFPANGETLVVDIHMLETFEPEFDIAYFINSGAFCSVSLSFTIKPYGRGAPETATLSTSTATSKAPLVFTVTGVKGDVAALGTLVVANATTAKTFGIYGVQSRYYSAASGAALFLEAEDGSADTATLNAGAAGASGAGANKVMRHLDVGTTGADTSYFIQGSGGGSLEHVGSFRVLARVQPLSTNTGTVSVRLAWTPSGAAGNQIVEDWVPIQTTAGTAIKGSWVIVDLGLVTIRKARQGTQQWRAELIPKSTIATDDIDYDWVTLVPVTEPSGQLVDTGNTIVTAGAVEFGYEAVQIRTAGTVWFDPLEGFQGDYVRVPVAGAEARTVRFVVLLAGPTSNTGNYTMPVIDAVNLDAITATLTYIPRFLVVPSP